MLNLVMRQKGAAFRAVSQKRLSRGRQVLRGLADASDSRRPRLPLKRSLFSPIAFGIAAYRDRRLALFFGRPLSEGLSLIIIGRGVFLSAAIVPNNRSGGKSCCMKKASVFLAIN